MKIVYIHGFASTGEAVKGRVLREHFGSEAILSPTLPVDPVLAIEILENLIEQLLQKNESVNLVGSSLGGFYSIFLAEKYSLKAVLVNPVIDAPVVMRRAIGFHRNWQTGVEFEFTDLFCDSLQNFVVSSPFPGKYLLLLQDDDELLDYGDALNYLPLAERVVRTGGGHHYHKFIDEMENINRFIEN